MAPRAAQGAAANQETEGNLIGNFLKGDLRTEVLHTYQLQEVSIPSQKKFDKYKG